MGTNSFTQLDAWKKAHQLDLMTQKATESFPGSEAFRLTDQSCRAAASVPANIAEGYARRQPRDKIRFYNHSEGSLQELKNHIIKAKALGYITKPDLFFKLIQDVESMLRKLIKSVARDL
jgi:four helix bundle protein